jgi:hypothetical protein
MDVTDVTNENVNDEPDKKNDDEAIDTALAQMSSIYKSRCIQPARGSNVTIREIKKDE